MALKSLLTRPSTIKPAFITAENAIMRRIDFWAIPESEPITIERIATTIITGASFSTPERIQRAPRAARAPTFTTAAMKPVTATDAPE